MNTTAIGLDKYSNEVQRAYARILLQKALMSDKRTLKGLPVYLGYITRRDKVLH